MKRNIYNILIIISLIFLFSCENKNEQITINSKKTPKALQDKNVFSINKNLRTGDLIEAIYLELVDNSPKLEKLEKEIMAFKSDQNDLFEKFNNINNKSKNYYYSAENNANNITDSILRKRIVAIINSSKSQYLNSNAQLNLIMKQLAKNDSNIDDHHTVMKILLTLPLIEKYLKENKLNNKDFQDFIKTQENIIIRIDNKTPRY